MAHTRVSNCGFFYCDFQNIVHYCRSNASKGNDDSKKSDGDSQELQEMPSAGQPETKDKVEEIQKKVQKVRIEEKPPNEGCTKEALLKDSRKFNIDLTPKVSNSTFFWPSRVTGNLLYWLHN